MPRYLTELIGTFFLVLIIALTVAADPRSAPLLIGVGLTALVYMGGPVSGAHYNPAITLAFLLRASGTFRRADALPYLAAQLAGALAAAALASALTTPAFAPAPAADAPLLSALAVEAVFTFILALVILHVATSPRTRGNSYYGVAIGATVAAIAAAGGPISGGAFNPAVGLGPLAVRAITGGGPWMHAWIYIAGPALGAVAAVAAYKLQHADPARDPTPAPPPAPTLAITAAAPPPAAASPPQPPHPPQPALTPPASP